MKLNTKFSLISLMLLFSASTTLPSHVSNCRHYCGSGAPSKSFLSTVKESLSNIPFGKIALITAGGIGALALGKWAYNYFFTLTDAQELEKAIILCNRARMTNNDLHYAYDAECSIFESMCQPHIEEDAIVKPSYAGSASFKMIITQKFDGRPYLNYALAINRDIQTLTSLVQELARTKVHLFERKLALYSNPDMLTQPAKIETLINEYTKTIEFVEQMHNELPELIQLLGQIRAYVIRMPEYEREYQLARIEELERENARLQAYNAAQTAACAHAWSHAHQTQTHIHVHHQEPCCNTSSCAQECPTTCSTEVKKGACSPTSCCAVPTAAEHVPAQTTSCAQTCQPCATSGNERTTEYEQFRNDVFFTP